MHYLHFVIMVVLITALFEMQTHVYADNITNQLISSYNHTSASGRLSNPQYLNDAQIFSALNLTRNSTQFQSLVRGYNYTFEGIFEYASSGPQINSGLKIYAVDFTANKSASSSGKIITVWVDPTLTKVVDIMSSTPLIVLREFGVENDYRMLLLCSYSNGCIMRGLSIPPEATSVCDTPSGCNVIGPSGYEIHLAAPSVPEFPLIIPVFLISIISLIIFNKIKYRIKF
jgi:hypothetical protein